MKTKETLLIYTAYLLVIIIWSTTPLAIKWSSQGIDFISGVTARMFIGATISVCLAIIWYRKLPLNSAALKVYFASALSIYGSMMMVYWGAQYITSGLISVIFGLNPFFTALFAYFLLVNESFSMNKFIGVTIAISGLVIIFSEQLLFGHQAIWGISVTLASVILHSISSVWIKRLNTPLPALIITAGGLLLSLPLFALTFCLFSNPLPLEIPIRTSISIIYLGTMGSVVGFVSYYFILTKLSPTNVALITMITPISALLLGQWFNHEEITQAVFYGTALVLLGLSMYQLYEPLKKKTKFISYYK
ncbi:MAG: DMT family transporter [Gammaproteobacteria bacterium]|nr:DMT family transporter [Gammaproteobacteria bacterium]